MAAFGKWADFTKVRGSTVQEGVVRGRRCGGRDTQRRRVSALHELGHVADAAWP